MDDQATVEQVCSQDSGDPPNVAPVEVIEYRDTEEVRDGGNGK